MSSRLPDEFKARVVEMILRGRAEEAIAAVCEALGKTPPKIKVGRVKGHSRALATYVPSKNTIYVSDGELMKNPFIILHELYHHIRMFSGRHRGTEKHADRFARSFLEAYKRAKCQSDS
ncbi:MAG TPA: hypothetical protein ENF83_01950 [Candidatus Korarchaeota archaeon]|nr:hypothetical protein [Candidatus Korarchaeota archaeon]